jgi:iron complex transport system substrate-binding protein
MRLLLALLLLFPVAAHATDIVDATGRTVTIPDHVTRILPAGPPAAVLLVALAPDLMLGFPMDVSPEARAFLSPEAASLPRIPRLTGKQDVTEEIRALKPDLIVDYGDVTPAYADLAQKTQEKLGVPVILLDGALAKTPDVLRLLGKVLQRRMRAEELAEVTAHILSHVAAPTKSPPSRVIYVRGSTDLRAVGPGSGAAEDFAALGWDVLAPPGTGTFRPVTLEQIAALDPDILIFADARVRGIVAASDGWRALRAVREGHALIAPALPFGWIEEPPSLNRLLGLAWLRGGRAWPWSGDFEAMGVASELCGPLGFFGGHPDDASLDALAKNAKPLPP